MSFDLLIWGADVVFPHKVEKLAIAINEGKIVEISPSIHGSAKQEIEAVGRFVLPGLIDVHVHFNDPGRAEWEGIPSGSKALATGGGVCFFDMPLNASPPTLDGASFDRKARAAKGCSYTDYAFWGGMVPGNRKGMAELAKRGVIGFKAFLSESGMDDFPRSDNQTLKEGMKLAALLDLPVAVHAEDEKMTSILAAQARAEGRIGLLDFFHSRPAKAEVTAIEKAIDLAGETACRLHIVHVSHPVGVEAVMKGKAMGVDVSCETCPHYLVLDEQEAQSIGAAAKCAPPLRDREAVEKLWEMLQSGHMDWVASDHSASGPELKRGQDFFQIWGGISGCQSTLPLLFSEGYQKRGLDLSLLSRLLATHSAEKFRLAGKGRIAIGNDADLVIVNPRTARPLRASDLQYRHPITPYIGYPIHGLVEHTLLRGKPASQPVGQLLRPTPIPFQLCPWGKD